MADDGPTEEARMAADGGGAAHEPELLRPAVVVPGSGTSQISSRIRETAEARLEKEVHGGAATLHDVNVDEAVLR